MTLPDLDNVYRAHAKRLVAVAVQITGSHALGEDAVHEAFVSAHRARGAFRGASTPETWLYRITIRAAGRLRQKQQAGTVRDAQRRTDRPPNHPEPAVGTELEALRHAVDALPEELRLVVILMNLRDLPAALVGEILGVPEGTVWSRAYRARRLMRETLAGETATA